jgi:hypothetical protein
MRRGQKCERLPADVIGSAVVMGKIATGEIEDITTNDGKNAAVALGRMSGKARAPRSTIPPRGLCRDRKAIDPGYGPC